METVFNGKNPILTHSIYENKNMKVAVLVATLASRYSIVKQRRPLLAFTNGSVESAVVFFCPSRPEHICWKTVAFFIYIHFHRTMEDLTS
jgi:hypothetical protein